VFRVFRGNFIRPGCSQQTLKEIAVISALLVALLAAHLLCVNVASGGPIVAAWLDWRGTRGEEPAAQAAAYLGRTSIVGLLAGALLGVVIGWLKWDANYRALWLGPLSYKLHWAGIEAIFSLALMLGWWLWLPGRAGGSRHALAARSLVAVLSATNLLYHFPVLFSVAGHLADAGETGGEQIAGAAFRQLMVAGETPALAVHVALASLAMPGTMLLGLALRWQRRGDEASASKIARWGACWALLPSIAQLPVGLWTLMALPAAAQSQLMGSSTLGISLFLGSLGAALWLINDLVHVAIGEVARPIVTRAMAAMLVTVILMTAMQQQTRPVVGQAFLPAIRIADPYSRQAGMPAPREP
jgi:hypothetical protein